MFVVSLCCTSLYMIIADKIPYSIYSDGNFKRRQTLFDIVCVFCGLYYKARSIYFKEISYAKFHRNPSSMNGWYAAVKVLKKVSSKLTKLENMQKSRFIWFIWRLVTQKRYVMRHGDYDTSDIYFDKEHFETNQKSLRLPVQKLWLT